MIREIYYFFRYGPRLQKLQESLGPVEFQKRIAKDADADGYAELRASLVGDLEGEILEIGTGTGAMFSYFCPRARVTAIEPHEDFCAAAVKAATEMSTEVRVLPGSGEELPFADASFDAVSASLVLCSVTSPPRVLKEIKRVLRPGGKLRLLEHVRSEHWLAGPLMDSLNPVWLRVNKVGCNWNRRSVEGVLNAGFTIKSVEPYKIFSAAAPAAFPLRLIKAECPQ